jgi:glycosyltransferase involved in cell wall biosynthesis
MRARRPVVALVTDAIFPFHRGGKEIRYQQLARRLARHAEVHVHTMRWWDGPASFTEDGVTYRALCPRLRMYVGSRRSILQAVVFALSCLRLLGRRFDAIEADHMPYLPLATLRLVATLRRRPLVVTWHEVWGPAYWREYLGRAGAVGWWVERAAMRLPDRIVAASPTTGARLRAHLGDRTPVTVAPNGVDLEEIDRAPAAAERVDVVTVGRLIGHKRVDLLLDAIAGLRAAGREVTCRVIGAGPAAGELRAHAAAAGVDDLVEFRDDLAGPEALFGHLKAAGTFVLTSEREGFGIAVLEALACGVRVVTTSAPDNLAQELVGRSANGLVCPPEAAAVGEAIVRSLDSEVEHPNREAWVREYDWDRIADDVRAAVLA